MSLPLFKALDTWPHPESKATRSPFEATMYATETLLTRELRAVRAQYPLLSLVADERAVRQDGHLRSNARVQYRGVILSFEQPGVGQVSYACDRFTASYRGSLTDWQHNLRAIALGMEALRNVERYGIAYADQQYAGFAAIGATSTGTALGAGLTPQAAAETLWKVADCGLPPDLSRLDPGAVTRAYRVAARRCHPDTGSAPDGALFAAVTEARDLLTKGLAR